MLRHVKKKENKRCIPKEGMPHAQACQKKIKDSPLSKKKEKERDGAYKGVHTPSLVIKTTFKRRENDVFTRKRSCEIDV